MFSHVTLGCNDFERARPFWSAVMEALAHPLLFETETLLSFGLPDGPTTFVVPPFDETCSRSCAGLLSLSFASLAAPYTV